MSEKKKVNPIKEYGKLWLAAMLVLIVPILIAYRAGSGEERQSSKVEARAKIIRIEETASKDHVAVYIFNVDGTSYKGSESIGINNKFHVGDSVRVEYSLANPIKNSLTFY